MMCTGAAVPWLQRYLRVSLFCDSIVNKSTVETYSCNASVPFSGAFVALRQMTWHLIRVGSITAIQVPRRRLPCLVLQLTGLPGLYVGIASNNSSWIDPVASMHLWAVLASAFPSLRWHHFDIISTSPYIY